MEPIIPAPSFPFSSSSTRPKVRTARLRKGWESCGECQRQKTICRFRDEAAACERCTKHRLACTFHTDQDGRQSSTSRRRFEEMRAERDTLVELFQALKNSSDADIAPLLDLIRSKASLADIRLHLDNDRSQHRQQRSSPPNVEDKSSTLVENAEHANQ
ncbi:uncharacterized protein BO95DRAFT_235073 [Aspergillus brunneoviolaceus CBS 621.78]|uniref:Uncharacterized protein n=1 Tax=Aspergillus brunneoviolaceus CBS 621.78 TaxID=1450534 RepID=A0ACD1FZL9_9EURO|nr:hypothetical protein BO95DRAFT_235073 [Aspergillus brunneoviolaceus CBS 621.78]RAH42398.1 hypothetical protein BO95DRAFT_235073 [Aspergillus brunneoviolaceus CBS 621.78]